MCTKVKCRSAVRWLMLHGWLLLVTRATSARLGQAASTSPSLELPPLRTNCKYMRANCRARSATDSPERSKLENSKTKSVQVIVNRCIICPKAVRKISASVWAASFSFLPLLFSFFFFFFSTSEPLSWLHFEADKNPIQALRNSRCQPQRKAKSLKQTSASRCAFQLSLPSGCMRCQKNFTFSKAFAMHWPCINTRSCLLVTKLFLCSAFNPINSRFNCSLSPRHGHLFPPRHDQMRHMGYGGATIAVVPWEANRCCFAEMGTFTARIVACLDFSLASTNSLSCRLDGAFRRGDSDDPRSRATTTGALCVTWTVTDAILGAVYWKQSFSLSLSSAEIAKKKKSVSAEKL